MIFVIRTANNPFRSRPSVALVASVLVTVAIGVLLPFTPVAESLGFVPLPAGYFLFLIAVTGIYVLLVDLAKRWLMRRWMR